MGFRSRGTKEDCRDRWWDMPPWWVPKVRNKPPMVSFDKKIRAY